MVKELLCDLRDTRLLDLGCGDGSLSMQFSDNNNLTLVDLSKTMLEKAKEKVLEKNRSNVSFVESDLYDFESLERYDVIICVGVMAWVDDVDEAVGKISRLLMPGGHCILEFHDNSRLAGKLIYNYYEAKRCMVRTQRMLKQNKLTWTTFTQLVASHGLDIISAKRHVLMLPGLGRLPSQWLVSYDMWVSRTPSIARHASEVVLFCQKQR